MNSLYHIYGSGTDRFPLRVISSDFRQNRKHEGNTIESELYSLTLDGKTNYRDTNEKKIPLCNFRSDEVLLNGKGNIP